MHKYKFNPLELVLSACAAMARGGVASFALVVLFIVSIGLPIVSMAAPESKYSVTGSVTFGPSPKHTAVTGIFATSDLAAGTITLYARGSVNKVQPTVAATNGATVITFANTSQSYTNADHVVYVHSDGTLNSTTLSAGTTSNVTLTAGLAKAGTTDDYLYRLESFAVITVNENTGGTGTNDTLNIAGDMIWVTKSDSPLKAVLTGTTITNLSVTVNK